MFPDLTQHPDYLSPQSKSWCEQLAERTGKYEYTWNYNQEGTSAEDILAEELSALLHGKALDVGCGHGEFTNGWADHVEELVGYDMTEGFITSANLSRKPNVRYVVGRTHDGLPFEDNYFDIAYTKKGPTSWYQEGNRIVRPGGTVLLLHPVDGNGEGEELGACFPGLFATASKGTPVMDLITERLAKSGLTDIHMRSLKQTGWIPTAEDVLAMKCFGQNERFTEYVRESCFKSISSLFERNASKQGIKVTGFYCLIRAKAAR